MPFQCFLITSVKTLPWLSVIMYVFRKDSKRKPWNWLIMILLTEAALTLSAIIAIPYIPGHPPLVFLLSIGIVLLLSVLSHLYLNFTLAQNLFNVFLMTTLVDGLELITLMTYTNVNLKNIQLTYSYAGRLALITLLFLPLYYLFTENVLKPLISISRQMAIWKYICLIPAAFFVLYRLVIDPIFDAFYFSWAGYYKLLPLAWVIGLGTVYFVTIHALWDIASKIRLEEQLHYSQLLVSSHEKQLLSLRQTIDGESRARHDFRHSLLVLQKHARAGNCQAILDHIDNYMHIQDLNQVPPVCENFAVNTILQHFLARAQNDHVRTKVTAFVPADLPFAESDICILVGNLMENAVEACGRQAASCRSIELSIQMNSPKILSMTIQNTFEGTIQKAAGDFLSSKRSGPGIGLNSVKHIAEKYQGVVNINYSDQIFTVSVLLNALSDHAK